MDKPVDGALCHAEMTADDVERCKAFYAEVLGWTFQDIPKMQYTIFRSGEGGIGGGIAKRGEHAPPHPVHYMQCEDLDATIERVKTHGGEVVTPRMEVGEAGWTAHVKDTEGNLFGLWQGKGG